MKYLILIIVTVLLSVVNGYSQYRISIDSSFNFGDKERFLKQSTGLSGNIIAAKLNNRGNYLVCINSLINNQRSYYGGCVLEITSNGSIIKQFSQVPDHSNRDYEITSFTDMYVDDQTGLIYLLARSPYKAKNLPKRREAGVIVLDSNFKEVKKLLVPARITGQEDYARIWNNEKFIHKKDLNQLYIVSSIENNGRGHTLFKIQSDSIVQIFNYPRYYLNWINSAACVRDKVISIIMKRDFVGFGPGGETRLSFSIADQLPDTVSLNQKLNWGYYSEIYEYSADQVLVHGYSNGKFRFALINSNLDVDTTSLAIRNFQNYRFRFFNVEGNNVIFKYELDSTFALNNHYWEMNIDGTNFRPSAVSWYPDPTNQSNDLDWFDVLPIKGSNNYFAQFPYTNFLIENKKVNLNFNKRLGPDFRRVVDIQPTINNQWFVNGDFFYYNNKKANGLVRIYDDGSVDTTFRFSFNNFSFMNQLQDSEKLGYEPEIISPLKNGDVIMAFANASMSIKERQRTYKLDKFGNVKSEFVLDTNVNYSFSKVQDFGNGRYLAHRLENYDDREVIYNRTPTLDINITDTNGKIINQLLVSLKSPFESFHLVKVKIIDSAHYLLAYCRQSELEQNLEKGEFYIYKLSVTDKTVDGLQPIYYRNLLDYSFVDFSNDGCWSIKIQNNKNKDLYKIINFNESGIATDSFLTTIREVTLFPQIKLLDDLKLSLPLGRETPSFERFNLFKNDTISPQFESTDFVTLNSRPFSYSYIRPSLYRGRGTRVKRINDTSFWYFSSSILFNNENKGSVSGFFRIKIKETKIASEPNQLNAKVFPNPTNGNAYIELPFYYEDGLKGNIMVTDISGKQMYKDSFTLLKYENLQFDFSKYNSGLYFVRVETNGRIYYSKVVKR